jgi:hypothetical protein
MKLSKMVIVAQAITANRSILQNLPLATLEELQVMVNSLQAAVTTLEQFAARNSPVLRFDTLENVSLTLSEHLAVFQRPIKNEILVKTTQLEIWDEPKFVD